MNWVGFGLREVALRTCVLCIAACWLAGCAEGYEGVEAIRQSAYGTSTPPLGGGGTLSPTSGTGAGGMSGGGGMTGSAGASTTPGSTGVGDPCQRGETKVCTCVDKGTMGQQTCVFDDASPLDGFYSECSRCPDPAPPPDPGDVMTAGSGGSGGRSGSGGSGSAGSGSAGSGSAGSGSAGSSSPPPTSGGGRTCSSPCNQPCFPIGILACCNPLGVCGCTWVPGGYCL